MTYLRDQREAIAKCQFTPVDAKWIETNKQSSRGEPMQIRSVASELKRGDRPDLYEGAPSSEAPKAIIWKSQRNIFSAAHRHVTCVLSRQGSETCAGTSASGSFDAGKQKDVRHSGRSKHLGAGLAITPQIGDIKWGSLSDMTASWSRGRQIGLQISWSKLQESIESKHK